MDIAVRSDVVRIGRDDDGTDLEGLVYYVLARDETGRQWAHGKTFPNWRDMVDPEEGPFKQRITNDIPEGKAQAFADRITKAVEGGASLDLAHWQEVEPAYGSDAWQGLDASEPGGYFRNQEIRDAADAGEISDTEARRRIMG